MTGVVAEVFVAMGQDVEVNAPLFRLDDRSLQAELKVRQAELAITETELKRLQSLPRKEELPVSESIVQEEQADVAEKEDNFHRIETLFKKNAASASDLNTAKQSFKISQAQLAHALADLALLRAGAWDRELAASQASVDKAKAAVEQTRTEIALLTVRARTDAQVLQVNLHPGEFVTAFGTESLIVLGNTQELHVRVDIDENDIPRFREQAAALAILKGRSDVKIQLAFLRVQPFVIPKKSLTGDTTERVDTRVLQVIYKIQQSPQTLYVGQQLDVFIDAS